MEFLTPDADGFVLTPLPEDARLVDGEFMLPLPEGSEVVEKDGKSMLRMKAPTLDGMDKDWVELSDGQGRAAAVADLDSCQIVHIQPDLSPEAAEKYVAEEIRRHEESLKKLRAAEAGTIPTVPFPDFKQGFSTPEKSPLYDHAVLKPGKEILTFFVCARHKGLARSNVLGDYGGLPARYHFYWAGLSLIPDASADPEDILRVWESGFLEFRFGSRVFHRWPCREIMLDPQDLPTITENQVEGLAHKAPVRNIALSRPFPFPVDRTEGEVEGPPHVEILALEAWQVRLEIAEPVKAPTGLMVVLYGTQLTPL